MIAGLIYAGGKGERLGGVDKALVPLLGAPLISWVHARLRPQVDIFAVSARDDPQRFAFLQCPILPDPPESGEAEWGPVAGLVSGLRWAKEEGAVWLVTAPTDGPFLHRDLVARLTEGAPPAAIAVGSEGFFPTTAAWRLDQISVIEAAVAEGERALKRLLQRVSAHECYFPHTFDSAFFNVNDAADLETAAQTAAIAGLRPPSFQAQ